MFGSVLIPEKLTSPAVAHELAITTADEKSLHYFQESIKSDEEPTLFTSMGNEADRVRSL
jgi:hypothetical protein